MEGVDPRERYARVEEALRHAHVAWPIPLVRRLALGKDWERRGQSAARDGDARAAIGKQRLPLARNNALEVRRRDEGVSQVMRLVGVEARDRREHLISEDVRVVVQHEGPPRKRLRALTHRRLRRLREEAVSERTQNGHCTPVAALENALRRRRHEVVRDERRLQIVGRRAFGRVGEEDDASRTAEPRLHLRPAARLVEAACGHDANHHVRHCCSLVVVAKVARQRVQQHCLRRCCGSGRKSRNRHRLCDATARLARRAAPQ